MTSTALAPAPAAPTHNGAQLARADYTSDQIELIKRQIAVGASDDELRLFLYQAQKTGLDPFARQIYCIKRGDKSTIQTGIDGYRLIAARTGLYAGSDDPVFTGNLTITADDGKLEVPEVATVTVWKIVAGVRCPFTASARWTEYYPGPKLGRMWHRFRHLMLSKCAEALALRKAFPAELSGLYVDAEMDQAAARPELEASPRRATLSEAPKSGAKAAPAKNARPGPPPADRACTPDEYALYQKWSTRARDEGVEHAVLPKTAKISQLKRAIDDFKAKGVGQRAVPAEAAAATAPATSMPDASPADRMRANQQEFIDLNDSMEDAPPSGDEPEWTRFDAEPVEVGAADLWNETEARQRPAQA